MVARLWSIPLEGDQYGASILVDTNGGVVVSTVRNVEEATPEGLSHSTKTIVRPSPKTTYLNDHAHRCYTIERSGVVAWTAQGVHARCVAPDGTLIATNDRHELLVLDRTGTVSSVGRGHGYNRSPRRAEHLPGPSDLQG